MNNSPNILITLDNLNLLQWHQIMWIQITRSNSPMKRSVQRATDERANRSRGALTTCEGERAAKAGSEPVGLTQNQQVALEPASWEAAEHVDSTIWMDPVHISAAEKTCCPLSPRSLSVSSRISIARTVTGEEGEPREGPIGRGFRTFYSCLHSALMMMSPSLTMMSLSLMVMSPTLSTILKYVAIKPPNWAPNPNTEWTPG